MRRAGGAAPPGPWVGMEGRQSQGPAGGLERGAERGRDVETRERRSPAEHHRGHH